MTAWRDLRVPAPPSPRLLTPLPPDARLPFPSRKSLLKTLCHTGSSPVPPIGWPRGKCVFAFPGDKSPCWPTWRNSPLPSLFSSCPNLSSCTPVQRGNHPAQRANGRFHLRASSSHLLTVTYALFRLLSSLFCCFLASNFLWLALVCLGEYVFNT